MIVEEIQGNIANLSNSEKQKHVEKVYLEIQILLNVFKESLQTMALK